MPTNRPPASILRDLYEVQNLSTREIGDRFGVTHTSVRRWLKQAGIEVRPHAYSLKELVGDRPDAETLNRLVHEQHHSYDEIAEMYNVSGATIKFWLDRFGIPRPTVWGTRRRGKAVTLPTFAELWELYVEKCLSTDVIGKRFNTTAGMIADACREAGIPLRRSGFNADLAYICDDGAHVRSASEALVVNWLVGMRVPYEYEPALPFINDVGTSNYRADFLVNGWYIEVWGVEGNRRYDERREFKVMAYHGHSLPLIELPAESFRSGEWIQLLKAALVHPTIQTFQGSPE